MDRYLKACVDARDKLHKFMVRIDTSDRQASECPVLTCACVNCHAKVQQMLLPSIAPSRDLN